MPNLLSRTDCHCMCHRFPEGVVNHIVACCDGNPFRFDPAADMAIVKVPCCPFDSDLDGNCHIHAAPGVLRIHTTAEESQ